MPISLATRLQNNRLALSEVEGYNSPMKSLIIVPAYNEERAIKDAILELKREGFKQIIVVDDGSYDKTFVKAKRYATYAIRHFINRGKGAAVKTGMEAAKKLKPDIIITFDADGQHNPKYLKHMIKRIEQGYDVVLGYRNYLKDGVPRIRIVGNHLGNFFTWLVHGIWVRDSQCGLKVFSRRAYSLIDTQTDRYEYDSEIAREIKRHQLKFIQIPIKVRYTDHSKNKAHKMNFRNGVRMIGRMLIAS